jgi:nucleotide-binding universal stress UspA family protein
MTSSPVTKFPVAKILVCVAEGAASDHAVRAAAMLAASCDAKVDLLHVVEPILAPSRRYMTITGPDISHTHAENVQAKLREHLAREFANLRLDGKPVEQALATAVGAPSRVVLERSANYDLVFVGESGRRKQLDFGGLARALFAHCTTPLWIQVDAPRPVERILAPTDLSPKSLEVLQRAVAFAKPLGAKVTALHCFVAPDIFAGPDGGAAIPSPTYTIDSLREAEQRDFAKTMEEFDWHGVAHEVVFAQDDPARRILASQDNFDLIVLGSHGQSALLASVLGSVAWRVLRMAHTGMLLVRTPGGYALGS